MSNTNHYIFVVQLLHVLFNIYNLLLVCYQQHVYYVQQINGNILNDGIIVQY